MTYQVKIKPADIVFDASPDDTVLGAAMAQKVAINYSCNTGTCGECKAHLVAGDVSHLPTATALTEADKAAGFILTCQAKAQSDLVIETEYYPELSNIEIRNFPCKVAQIERVADDVIRLQLRLPPTAKLSYLPGQYIDLKINGIQRSYSIANAQQVSAGVELHIRKVPGGQLSTIVFDQLKTGQLLRLEGPKGCFFVRDSERPIIFVAGGTGFAPVKSMVEDLLDKQSKRQLTIFWGAQHSLGIYDRLPSDWAEQHKNVFFVPVISGEDASWTGKTGFVHQAVLDQFGSLSGFDVYACGSPVMVEAARQDFIKNGLENTRFFSDSFVPSST